MLAALLLLAGLLLAGTLDAQQPAAPPPAAPAEVEDTAHVSARGALIRSLVLPGWGQAFVGAPARGALYFALESGSLWMVFKSRRALDAARAEEAFLHESGRLKLEDRLPLAEARRQQVEDWITLAVFWALFAGADAYVAAQLTDFAEHIGTVPAGDGSLRLEARIPVGRVR